MASGEWIEQVSLMLGEEEAEAARRVVASGWLTEGQETAAFVAEMNAVIGTPYGVLAPNGTLALALGLMALGIGPGDEVLVPDTTFIASATAVLLVGARPVFVDVEPTTFQIDVANAETRLTRATRAIMPVHLYGTACDMDAVMGFAAKHGLKVIEDAAQGVGVRFKGRQVGGIGDVGCFSFSPGKTVTMGEGGFVACRDAAVHERLCLLRNQGRMESGTFVHQAVGFNFRITAVQAAVGRVQLRKLADTVARKHLLHAAYVDALRDIDSVRLLGAADNANLVAFRCVLLANDVRGLMAHFAGNKVQARSFFYPLHRQPAFADLTPPARGDRAFPNATMGYSRGVLLPLHCAMSLDDVARIAGLVRSHHFGRSASATRGRPDMPVIPAMVAEATPAARTPAPRRHAGIARR